MMKKLIKYGIVFKVFTAICLFPNTSYPREKSNELSVAYGLGVFNSAKSSIAETKTANLAYRYFLVPGIYLQSRAGFWGDGSRNENRRSSSYGSLGPGIEVDLKPIELRSGWGVAYISTPDSFLGARTSQFNGDLYVGVRDKNSNGIGMSYGHISNAGIKPGVVNKGRDFLVLEISKKW